MRSTAAGAALAEGGATAPASEEEWRREAQAWGERYNANSSDPQVAIHYAQALRQSGQRAQAVAVLEQASLRNPRNMEVLGAYGRALADVGNYQQALDVLGRAHVPEHPDWRILSAQGAVLDQIGRHADAQRYYETALKIAPDEPTVLSNLGLSYALSKDLPRAEATLKRADACVKKSPGHSRESGKSSFFAKCYPSPPSRQCPFNPPADRAVSGNARSSAGCPCRLRCETACGCRWSPIRRGPSSRRRDHRCARPGPWP